MKGTLSGGVTIDITERSRSRLAVATPSVTSRRPICQLSSNHVSPLMGCACAPRPPLPFLPPKSFNFNEFLLARDDHPFVKAVLDWLHSSQKGNFIIPENERKKSWCTAHFVFCSLLCISAICEREGEKFGQKTKLASRNPC